VGRIMVSKDVSYLSARTCEYVALHGRKNFADVIKVKDPKMGRLSWGDYKN